MSELADTKLSASASLKTPSEKSSAELQQRMKSTQIDKKNKSDQKANQQQQSSAAENQVQQQNAHL
jgi:hypothetical protein